MKWFGEWFAVQYDKTALAGDWFLDSWRVTDRLNDGVFAIEERLYRYPRHMRCE
jgi:hypothetical protein